MILIFLIQFKPQKTTPENKKEILNEFSILMMSYFVLSFTGAEPDPSKRATLGRCLILISLSNIGFHLSGLIYDTVKKIIGITRKFVKRIKSKCGR